MKPDHKKIIVISLWTIAIYSLLGFLILPFAAKLVLEKKVSQIINHEIQVKWVSLNPFTFKIGLKEFHILDTDGTDLINWDDFKVNFQLASLWKKSWIFKSVELDKPYIKCVIAKGGIINLMSLAPESEAKTETPAPTQKTEPKGVVIRSLNITDGTFDFTDASNTHIFHQAFQPINLQAVNISTQSDDEGDSGITFMIADSGRITVVNRMSLNPLHGSADVTLESIPLNVFQPYLANMTQAELTSGLFSMTSRISYNPGHPTNILGLQGRLSIQSFNLTEQGSKDTLLGWELLNVNNFDVRWPANSVTLERFDLQKPEVLLALETGGLNLQRIFAPPSAGAQVIKETAVSASPPPALSLNIDTLSISDGIVRLRDTTVQPNLDLTLSEITLQALRAGIIPGTDIGLDFSARINETGRISAAGSIQPFDKPLGMNLKTSLENFSMDILEPYIGKFVGYEVNNGTLNLTMAYDAQSGRFQGSHDLVLDTFVLGKSTGSADATVLPVKLALYLIEDLNGQIKLNLPVDGDMNDPEFRYSHVIIQVVMNVLTKALASPFNLLGGFLGGGPVDLSFAGFAPNKAVVSSHEYDKILTLARALKTKPRLILIVQGAADPAYDIPSDKDVRELKRMSAESSSSDINPLLNIYDKVATAGGNLWPIRKIKNMIPQKEIKPVHLPPEKINMPALTLLAQQRARTVRDILINKGGIAPERITTEDPSIASSFADGEIKTTMSLSVE